MRVSLIPRLLVVGACFLLSVASPVGAAMQVGAAGDRVGTSGNGSVSLDYAGTTAGRGLYIIVMMLTPTSPPTFGSVTISGESNATLIGSVVRNATSGWAIQQAYLPALSSGGTKTVTATWTAEDSGAVIYVRELRDDVVGGIALDGHNGASGSSADPSFTVTTGTNNALVIGGLYPGGNDPTAGAGYTKTGISWFDFEAIQHNIDVGTAGAIPFNWTNAAGQWVMAAAGFKAASGGGGFNAFTRRRF